VLSCFRGFAELLRCVSRASAAQTPRDISADVGAAAGFRRISSADSADSADWCPPGTSGDRPRTRPVWVRNGRREDESRDRRPRLHTARFALTAAPPRRRTSTNRGTAPPGINPRDPRNPRMIRSVAVLPRALLERIFSTECRALADGFSARVKKSILK